MDDRYRSPEIGQAWSRRALNQTEIEIWLAVHKCTHPGSPNRFGYLEAASRYTANQSGFADAVDQLAAEIETETRHDLVARLRAFERQTDGISGRPPANELHWGLTSHDLVDNSIQVAVLASLRLVRGQAAQVAHSLATLADRDRGLRVVARTHGQPAQLTTLGYRWACHLQPLLDLIVELDRTVGTWPMRGLGGAVGHQADLRAILGGDGTGTATGSAGPSSASEGSPAMSTPPRATEGHRKGSFEQPAGARRASDLDWLDGIGLDPWFALQFGFGRVQTATGQIYHRVYDLQVAELLGRLAIVGRSHAQDIRHMAMLGQVYEARGDRQVGSSAMPHKANPIGAERVCALAHLADGYVGVFRATAATAWMEGDLSGSASRRVAWPDLFHAVTSLLAEWQCLLDGLEVETAAVAAERHRYADDISTGAVLSAAVRAGTDREASYALLWRWRLGIETPSIAEIADRLSLTVAELRVLLAEPRRLSGPIGRTDEAIDGLIRQTHGLTGPRTQ